MHDFDIDAERIKLGKRWAVGSVDIHGAGESNQVAHATCTYSIPS